MKEEKRKQVVVYIDFEVLNEILEIAKYNHPKEVILLLRGHLKKNEIHITDYLVPPFATSGKGFSHFNPYFLPMDFNIIGTAHSHPSGVLKPSIADLNHGYGKIMLIMGHPYISKRNVAIFSYRGEKLSFKIV